MCPRARGIVATHFLRLRPMLTYRRPAFACTLNILLALALTACSQTAPVQTNPTASHTQISPERFLADIANEPSVKKLSDEVYIKVLRQGYGCKPTSDSQVLAHYQARLADGTVVDSSIARGRPMTLPIAKTIKAWRLAVPLMNEGATWEIYTHPNAAYGERGSPPTIPPAAPMAFTVELIKAGTCQLQ